MRVAMSESEGVALNPDEQDMLFTEGMLIHDGPHGYRGAIAARAAGISYRQLDYWARTELVKPTVRGAAGLWITASLRLSRHHCAQACQAAARHGHFAAADPLRRDPTPRVGHLRSHRNNPHERRRKCLSLRI